MQKINFQIELELLKIKLLKLVSPRNQWRLDVKITSSKFQSRKLTMILQFYLQLGKGNFFSGRFGHSKNCFKTASYGIKWMFYPLIKLILLTVLWKPFSSHPHFPHTFSTQQWVKSAYQGVKYSLYSIRGSEENKFCCDQSCHCCWTMSGKIKKIFVSCTSNCFHLYSIFTHNLFQKVQSIRHFT